MQGNRHSVLHLCCTKVWVAVIMEVTLRPKIRICFLLHEIIGFVVLYGIMEHYTNGELNENLRGNFRLSAQRAAVIRDYCSNERIRNRNIVRLLENWRISGMPSTVCNVSDGMGMELFVQSYTKVTVLMRYWNIVLSDEGRYENGDLTQRINDLLNLLGNIQRTLYAVINSNSDSSRNSLNITVNTQEIQFSTREYRFQRDYVIARDTVKIMSCVSRQFED